MKNYLPAQIFFLSFLLTTVLAIFHPLTQLLPQLVHKFSLPSLSVLLPYKILSILSELWLQQYLTPLSDGPSSVFHLLWSKCLGFSAKRTVWCMINELRYQEYNF